MQKVINVYYGTNTRGVSERLGNLGYYRQDYKGSTIEDVNELLKKGWKVVLMQSFSQNVAAARSGSNNTTEAWSGAYGMTFVLEIDGDMFEDDEDMFEDDEDEDDY